MKLRKDKKVVSISTFSVLCIIVFFNSLTFADVNIYPTQGWQQSPPEEQGMQSKMLADMIEDIKTKGYNIDSILVIRNGYMVLDAYFHPFSKDLRHNIRSCTKSIMSILIGIAIDKGYIKSVDQPITDFFPEKKIANLDDNKRSITLEHLLMMASGLDCQDSYLYEWRGLSEMRRSDDWAQHVLDLPMIAPPGEKFEYCNGVSYLLSVILSTTTKMKTLDFAKKNLFTPLGISEIVWTESPQGIDVGYGGMWLKPHDMAKIGWLYINKGKWGEKQIVSAAWVDLSTRGHIKAKPAPQYGYQWWVNSDGNYAAVGYNGQFILVTPEMNLVIVFTGELPDGKFYVPLELTRAYIAPAVTSSEPLPADMIELKRLDNLVKSVSTSFLDGFVWLSREEGIAKDGEFTRVTSPKFTFTYPVGSTKLNTFTPRQVMRMKTPDEVHFEASVMTIPDNLKLKDFGPKVYADHLQSIASDVEVIANKETTLKCGTRAFRTDINWTYNDFFQVTSLVVSSYSGNKCVYLVAHAGPNPEKYATIVESLTFE